MKETRYFYAPDAATSTELPGDEAGHALRVLRMSVGDELLLVDGNGCFYRATITAATGHRCTYRIEETMPQQPAWQGHLHLAMAPTKLLDRVEWFAEKATEIGFDELTFLDCQFSERRVVKKERIDKILVSAMKQSHKAWKPKLNDMQRFRDFISEEREATSSSATATMRNKGRTEPQDGKSRSSSMSFVPACPARCSLVPKATSA